VSSSRPKVRRHTPRVPSVAAALTAIVAIALACYFVFGGSLPWASSPFVLKAVFTANTDLHIPSPVRIAGVDVGEVTGVQPIKGSANAGTVTMDIDANGLPIHRDATVSIRSRIFLEGNFYVQLEPGTPSAPILGSGATLPAANTAGPVQLDRVLSALNGSARSNLQALVRGFGSALNAPATPSNSAGQDPSVAGLTGAQALNENLKYAAGAFEASAIVNQALLGEQPHDLSGVVAGTSRVFKGLSASPSQLQGFVDSFEQTMSALAARQQALEQTIAQLPSLLQSADAADAQLDASFGPTRAFASAILPGIQQLGPTIDAALPWLSQLTALVSPSELGTLVHELVPAVKSTSKSIPVIRSLLSAASELSRCVTGVLLPASNEVIQDGPATTGLKVYQELFQSAVGIAGAGQNFDGNGRYVRASAGGGSQLVQTAALPGVGPLFGNAVLAPLGTRPAFDDKPPPLDSSRACYEDPVPNLNAAKTGAAP
jgi:phospholipid/cholesterol/gamma-HCH transport system substrate-binding protein